ncbi:MAG: RluA family pseudouridine synthase [Ancrocorticia sp.]|jgi:23S rRNA pseudouridine1911/1915/1917 synthase|nr:RluA family pseudouridine synthase [Ancrocorticia sp.]MCI1932071.1 RluA family pseudouridine synthase [Ancrocorticia sp.]MCI1963432.1 RluA family pseudouridine synthase [Ancrocorticia sp.]MCI2002374.1 RluA family pseudouridine synthase [Ancrocorticia sp.]MCI2012198.1 RluA family pseudouridine synthase [Ancrocorticia sp.]
MADRRLYPIPESLVGERVDAVIARVTGLSRAASARIIDRGEAWLDGKTVSRSDRVAAGQSLEVVIPDPPRTSPIPTDIDIPILYEDADIVVVDKPAGLAAHPSLNFEGPDVLGALMGRGIQLSAYGPPERKGIVHRLDVGTSGCMVVAKSELAYSVLKQAFRDRTVTKIYHALVQGHPDPLAGTIDAPIGRDHRHQWKMGIRDDGRHAITHYEAIEAMPGASLLKIHLETGRTHQIRVHMAAVGHPCVGDDMYGADPQLSRALNLSRQWLHAVSLGFTHPRTGEWVEFHAPYPDDLANALGLIRKGKR